jgi:hypothetical protein
MFYNRKQLTSSSAADPLFTGFGKGAVHPGRAAEDGDDWRVWFEAGVVSIPGIPGVGGIRTAGGELFCGDLLVKQLTGAQHMMDDPAASFASLDKLGR